MKINKVTYFLEKLWLVFAIVSMGMAIYRTYRLGIKESYILFFIGIVSAGMFYLRYSLRKQQENKEK